MTEAGQQKPAIFTSLNVSSDILIDVVCWLIEVGGLFVSLLDVSAVDFLQDVTKMSSLSRRVLESFVYSADTHAAVLLDDKCGQCQAVDGQED